MRELGRRTVECRTNNPLHDDESAIVLVSRHTLVVQKNCLGKRSTRDFANLRRHDHRRIPIGSPTPHFDTGTGDNRKSDCCIDIDGSGRVLEEEDLCSGS